MLVIDTPKPFSQNLRKKCHGSPVSPAAATLLALILLPVTLVAQRASAAPRTVDSSAEASPLKDPAPGPPVDSSAVSSPVGALLSGDSIPAGSQLQIQLSRALNSATAHNGEDVSGVLQAPVRTASGKTLPAGTAVTATVITASPAGTMTSAGELTLQLVRVGTISIFSDIVERSGQAGHRDVPDATPAKGTEATVATGSPLNFSVPHLPGV